MHGVEVGKDCCRSDLPAVGLLRRPSGTERDATRGFVSRAKKRAFDSTLVSPEGGTSEGPRPGSLSWLCLVGDTEASAAASASYRPTILGRRRGKCSAFLPDEGTGVAVHAAERRHRTAHHGWARDSAPSDHRTDDRTEIPAAPTRPGAT